MHQRVLLVAAVVMAVTGVLTASAAAGPEDYPAARAFCEKALGGDFQIGGIEPTGLPALYGCLGGAIREPEAGQPASRGTVDTFVTLCTKADGGGWAEVIVAFWPGAVEGDYYCVPPGF
jgi:hypothetical protein